MILLKENKKKKKELIKMSMCGIVYGVYETKMLN